MQRVNYSCSTTSLDPFNQGFSVLMGATGAGKTTLLDVLAGRKTGGVIEGDIRIGGYPKVQETFARISGYCEQIDVHSPQVTVWESVVYSAWLRLPTEIDPEMRHVSFTFEEYQVVPPFN